MKSGAKFDVDFSAVDEMLRDIQPKHLQGVYSAAFKSHNSIIKRQAKKELKNITTKSGHKLQGTKNPWHWKVNGQDRTLGVSLEQGIRSSVQVNGLGGTVHIFTPAAFGLRFFDLGTVERQYRTKKGKIHKTGSIKRTGFFMSAVSNSKDKAKSAFQDKFYSQLDKVMKKKYICKFL